MTENICPRSDGDANSVRAQPDDVPRWLRVMITWLAIFPTVTVGQAILAPFEELPLVLRSAILTAVAVPFAAYLAVPAIIKALAAMREQ